MVIIIENLKEGWEIRESKDNVQKEEWKNRMIRFDQKRGALISCYI